MNELEDQKLADHIRDVFDTFEDDGADMGWNELRKTYPEGKSRPILLWMSSVAAVLIIAAGLLFWNQTPDSTLTAVDKKQTADTADGLGKDRPERAIVRERSNIPNQQSTADADRKQPAETMGTEVHSPVQEKAWSVLASKTSTNKRGKPHPNSSTVTDQSLSATLIKGQKTTPAGTEQALSSSRRGQGEESFAKNTPNANIPNTTREQVLEEKVIVSHPIAHAQRDQVNNVKPAETESLVRTDQPRDSSFNGILAKSNAGIRNSSEPGEGEVRAIKFNEEPELEKISFAIVGGSYFNFAEGSESSLNFSAGLSSDIPLSRKLRLTTGISLAKNNLYYEQGVPTSGLLDFSNAPNYGQMPNGYINTASDYSAELVNLDIPINLKYITGRRGFFISGGLSSGTYLSESYTVAYRTFSLASNSYTTVKSTDNVRKSFSQFDLARTLNFSFGMNLPFGKKQNLTLEPFIKYPLQGLGSENLKFGASGVNLRLNFNAQNR